MRFALIEGDPRTVECSTCHAVKTAGSFPYISASAQSRGLTDKSKPDNVYLSSHSGVTLFYCEDCALSISQGEDGAKSVSQFYTDTQGNSIQDEFPEP